MRGNFVPVSVCVCVVVLSASIEWWETNLSESAFVYVWESWVMDWVKVGSKGMDEKRIPGGLTGESWPFISTYQDTVYFQILWDFMRLDQKNPFNE